MESMLSALAFALLIGGQFIAVIVVSSRKSAIFADKIEILEQPPDPIADHANENVLEVSPPAKAA